VASCATAPRVNFVPPEVPPPVTAPSAAVDKNDKTGEKGVWLNEKDAKALLSERIRLRYIIDAYRAYAEKLKK
jgi:hypothetical protein